MNESKKIYLVNAEPIGEELAKFKFPVIFRVMNESGLSEDITYNSLGERSVLKDTNTFSESEKEKLSKIEVNNSSLSLTSASSLIMNNSSVTFNSSSKFNMGSATLTMSSGSKLTITNSSEINVTNGYKISLGDNGSVPENLTSGAVIFAGSAGLLAENVNTETGKILLTSGSNAKLEVYDDNFILGGTKAIKYDGLGIKLGYNVSNKTYTLGYPSTSINDSVLIYNNGNDAEWIRKNEFFESMDPSILTTIINKPGNDDFILQLKTLLGLNQS